MSGKRTSKDHEITVFITKRDSRCGECGEELGKGQMLTLRGEGNEREALCLECSDLGHLEFLPRGNAALTRRASKDAGLRAVVVEWSRTRKRYERQGILAGADAIARAEEECLADAELRERRKARRREREEELDAEYLRCFAETVRKLYPNCPVESADAIASHACRKYSGRVGRSAAAKELDAQAIALAVRAHLRHEKTNYDHLLMQGWDRHEARREIAEALDAAEARWRG